MSGQVKGFLTLFESPDVLAKTWTLDAAGNPQKSVAAALWRGVYRLGEVDGVDSFAALLGGVKPQQAISASLPHDGSTSGRITTKKLAEPGAVVRSKSTFGLQSKPGFFLIDADASDAAHALPMEDLHRHLVTLIPALTATGLVGIPSGSSHVFHGEKDLTQLRGQHIYGLLMDASDGPRVTKTLAARFWLAGLGTILVSKSGSLLVRCPIDTAPTDDARLVFGPCQCGPGLEQRRGEPVILNRGGFLDSRALVPDLTAEEQGRYEALVEQAKAAALPQALQRRAEHRGAEIARRLPDLMKQGISAADAEQRVGASVDAAQGGTLLADFELTVIHDCGRREVVLVSEVLADRDKWHEKDCLDPVNPTHRNGAADCRLYLHGTSPIAYSLDSGSVHRLRGAQTRLLVARGARGELVEQIAAVVAADSRVFVNDAGPVLVQFGTLLTLTVDRLMNLVGTSLVLVTKTAKGDSPTDLTREAAVLVLAALTS